jgi:hypothetical protein
MIGRSQGHLAVAACVLGLGACTAPTAHTGLRPDGAPEVLAVLASDDASGAGVVENATFCKLNDNKRPGLIPADPAGPKQVCPDDLKMGADEVADVVPVGWYVRFQFDELLNPDKIEDLLPIIDSKGNNTGLLKGSLASTQPVTITCGGVDVAYDGYYDPSGNSFTWPVGPSLFVTPDDTSKIAAGTECQVTLQPDVVTDKDGNHVPADQLGPYKFKIADLVLVSTDPAAPKDPDKPSTINPAAPLIVTFNATVEVTSLSPAEVTMLSGVKSCTDTTGGVASTVEIAEHRVDSKDPTSVDKTLIEISDAAGAPATAEKPKNAWLVSTTYVITFAAGADVKDLAGAMATLPDAAKLTICFKTAT